MNGLLTGLNYRQIRPTQEASPEEQERRRRANLMLGIGASAPVTGLQYPRPRNERRMEDILPRLGKAFVRATLDPIALAARGDVPSNPGEVADYVSSLIPGSGAIKGSMALAGLGALGHTVYHGSPHRFDRFDVSKIGTGEGAQVYGHGLYFAESPEVARAYQKNVKDMGSIQDINKRMRELAKEMNKYETSYRQYNNPRGYEAAKEYDELMSARSQVSNAPGVLYKADIPDKWIPKMLDWDESIKNQKIMDVLNIEDLQSQLNAAIKKRNQYKGAKYQEIQQTEVAPIMQKIASRTQDILGVSNINAPGSEVYKALTRRLGGKAQAAEYLRDLGVPGVKYFDQMSRQVGEGTRNYVSFTDEGIKILERE